MEAAGRLQEGVHYRVDSATGCWLWLMSDDGNGYGQVDCRGFTRKAHRVSWENANGPIPWGRKVCHDCDVRRCINPAHLFLGTQRQNLYDAMRKKRMKKPPRNTHLVGERCPWTKLRSEEHTSELQSL
jgi:hypothetical protein